MIVRKTTPEENRRAQEIGAVCFEFPLRIEPEAAAATKPEGEKYYRWAAFTDDAQEMMGSITVNDYQIQFDGHSCKMGGIGGVSTLPQYRRQGCIRACFNTALTDMYANGYDFSYLYPFSTAYYRKFGYESCVQRLNVSVDLGILKPPAAEGNFLLAEKKHPMTEAIRAVDKVWETALNLMVQHTEADYEWTTELEPAAQAQYTYVYFSPDGTPKAYTTFKPERLPDRRDLVCSRFYFTDKEGFAGLMQLFKSLASDHKFVKFSLPSLPEAQYLLPELALEAIEFSVKTIGMVRVINAKSVLEKARYIGSGATTLQITDPQIAQNNGIYRIEFAGGNAISVKETSQLPDAILDISTFSALMMGVCDFSAAEKWMNGLDVKTECHCLNQVFYQKKMMIVDFF